MSKPLFQLGQVVATPGCLDELSKNNQSPSELLSRHVRGDWGSLCPEATRTVCLAAEFLLCLLRRLTGPSSPERSSGHQRPSLDDSGRHLRAAAEPSQRTRSELGRWQIERCSPMDRVRMCCCSSRLSFLAIPASLDTRPFITGSATGSSPKPPTRRSMPQSPATLPFLLALPPTSFEAEHPVQEMWRHRRD